VGGGRRRPGGMGAWHLAALVVISSCVSVLFLPRGQENINPSITIAINF